MSTTLTRKDGAFPWLMPDWYAFCQALYKGIEGKDGEEMYDSCKILSEAVGVKKNAAGSEGKSPVNHESSQGQKGRVL